MTKKAEYLLVLHIKEGHEAPTIEDIGAAMEVGTEGAPEEWGFDAIEQIVVKEPGREDWKFDLIWTKADGSDRDVNSGVPYFELVGANREDAELLYWLVCGPQVGDEHEAGGGSAPIVVTRRVA